MLFLNIYYTYTTHTEKDRQMSIQILKDIRHNDGQTKKNYSHLIDINVFIRFNINVNLRYTL